MRNFDVNQQQERSKRWRDMDRTWADSKEEVPRPDAANNETAADQFWAKYGGEPPQPDSVNNEETPDHYWAEYEEEPLRPAPVTNDALTDTPAEEKRSASRRFMFVWVMVAPYILVLLFTPIIELIPDKESTESRCLGNGQTSIELLGECWERLDGTYIGEVENYSIDGTNFTVHAWEVPTEHRDQEWIDDAVYARLDIWAGYGWQEYYTYFECQGLYNCLFDVHYDNKTWVAAEARKWFDGDDSPNATTMFVNIEEGGPVLIAIDSSIPLRAPPSVEIELIH